MTKHKAPKRKNFADTPSPVGMFGVIRNSASKTAKFCCLHDTYESAADEAKRLLTEEIGRVGPKEISYYVVELRGRVGIAGGVLLDQT